MLEFAYPFGLWSVYASDSLQISQLGGKNVKTHSSILLFRKIIKMFHLPNHCVPSVGKGAIFGRKTIVPWGLIEFKSKKKHLFQESSQLGLI